MRRIFTAYLADISRGINMWGTRKGEQLKWAKPRLTQKETPNGGWFQSKNEYVYPLNAKPKPTA